MTGQRGSMRAAALVILGISLVACTTRLVQTEPRRDSKTCVLPAEVCYAHGRDRFEAYRARRVAEIRQRSHGYRLPSAPVAELTGNRTEYVALLIHGLNDSAYYMGDLARVFARLGINAITVLLPAHGTKTEDMATVKAEAWRREVTDSLDIASLLGDKTILAGFSLGATLAVEAVLGGKEVYGLFLFSPAFEIQSKVVGTLTCLPLVRPQYVTTDLPINPVKYTRRSANSVCQLRRIMKDNLKVAATGQSVKPRGDERYAVLGSRVTVPTFIALTFGDIRITPASVLSFAGGIQAPTRLVTYGAPSDLTGPLANGGDIRNLEENALPHSFLLRRTNPYNGQMNPYFDGLEAEIATFVSEHLR